MSAAARGDSIAPGTIRRLTEALAKAPIVELASLVAVEEVAAP